MSASNVATSRRGRTIARLQERDDYGIVLALVLATIIAIALWNGPVGQLAAVGLSGFTLLFVLHTSDARRRTYRVASVVVVAAVVGAAAGIFLGDDRGTGAAGVVGLLLAFAAPIAILRRILRTQRITIRIVLGALAIYLLVGLTYSYLYPLIHVFTGQPFFTQILEPEPIDYIYFSYVTLTTVGYGDLTAATNVGRMIAVSEALSGQLYLVSAVALLVSNLGRTVDRGRKAAETDLTTDDA